LSSGRPCCSARFSNLSLSLWLAQARNTTKSGVQIWGKHQTNRKAFNKPTFVSFSSVEVPDTRPAPSISSTLILGPTRSVFTSLVTVPVIGVLQPMWQHAGALHTERNISLSKFI
jgi:hypothetical protein